MRGRSHNVGKDSSAVAGDFAKRLRDLDLRYHQLVAAELLRNELFLELVVLQLRRFVCRHGLRQPHVEWLGILQQPAVFVAQCLSERSVDGDRLRSTSPIIQALPRAHMLKLFRRFVGVVSVGEKIGRPRTLQYVSDQVYGPAPRNVSLPILDYLLLRILHSTMYFEEILGWLQRPEPLLCWADPVDFFATASALPVFRAIDEIDRGHYVLSGYTVL